MAASTELRIGGLAELRAALKKLPVELAREAGALTASVARATADRIVAAYPDGGTGNLRRGVSVDLRSDSAASVSAVVRNRAHHAYIYESGTGPRRWANGKSTGTMPAGRVFIPIAIVQRRLMVEALIDLVERAGLAVTGSAR
jgi:hypothetical protein